MNQTLPPELDKLLSNHRSPDEVFSALLPQLGSVLQCDRCFLYLRQPGTRLGRVPYCWRRDDRYPEIYDPDWKVEPASLPDDDPLFAAALRTEPSIFVEDVETANAAVVNRDFEQKNFGHRALIHAHLCQDGRLWGILQPCVFNRPRVWSAFDREIIEQVVVQIIPLAVAYVQTHQES